MFTLHYPSPTFLYYLRRLYFFTVCAIIISEGGDYIWTNSFEEFSKIILEKYSKTPDECDPYTNFALLMKQTSASVTLDILNEYHKTFIEKK